MPQPCSLRNYRLCSKHDPITIAVDICGISADTRVTMTPCELKVLVDKFKGAGVWYKMEELLKAASNTWTCKLWLDADFTFTFTC
jgi:hypothetical protein